MRRIGSVLAMLVGALIGALSMRVMRARHGRVNHAAIEERVRECLTSARRFRGARPARRTDQRARFRT